MTTGRGMFLFIAARFSSVSRLGDSVSIRITSGCSFSTSAVRFTASARIAATW
jgi:hypothetical protein